MNLKNNFFILLIFLFACSSAPLFKVSYSPEDYNSSVITTPDRVIAFCEPTNENNQHAFVLETLDEKNTVFSSGFRVGGKKECFKWINKVNEVLEHGRLIKITGLGNLEGFPRKNENKYFTTFPQLGTFPNNGRALKLWFVANDKKECFGHFEGKCRDKDFP